MAKNAFEAALEATLGQMMLESIRLSAMLDEANKTIKTLTESQALVDAAEAKHSAGLKEVK